MKCVLQLPEILWRLRKAYHGASNRHRLERGLLSPRCDPSTRTIALLLNDGL
jgi:hypothetical protein